jgi:hypothetical protein
MIFERSNNEKPLINKGISDFQKQKADGSLWTPQLLSNENNANLRTIQNNYFSWFTGPNGPVEF